MLDFLSELCSEAPHIVWAVALDILESNTSKICCHLKDVDPTFRPVYDNIYLFQLQFSLKVTLYPFQLTFVLNLIMTPEPGFEPGSEAPQAARISKLPHSGIWFSC